MELMLGHKHRIFWLYWKAQWLIITPIIIVLMLIMALVSYAPAEYDNKIIPAWAEFIGWLMVIAPILCVIGRALKMLLYRKVPFREALKPSKTYRPRHELNPDHDYVETEMHNIEAVEPDADPKSKETDDYYLNPIFDNHVTETNEVGIEDDLGHLQRDHRNPSFQNDLQDNPSPCPVLSERPPSDENENIEKDENT